MADLLFKDEVFQIVAAAMEVHSTLGSGFAEPVYQETMQIELAARAIPFEAQKIIRIKYKDHLLEKTYLADIVCFNAIIVELKAIDHLSGKEEAQLLNYLKATDFRVGLLFNFGNSSKLEWHRYVR
jgi:GxxExxY protein